MNDRGEGVKLGDRLRLGLGKARVRGGTAPRVKGKTTLHETRRRDREYKDAVLSSCFGVACAPSDGLRSHISR